MYKTRETTANQKKHLWPLALAAFALLASPVSAQQLDEYVTTSGAVKAETLEPCYVAGVSDRARCATFQVPLNYEDPAAGNIGIFAAILPATGTEVKDDPLLILAGGPGSAAADYGRLVHSAFAKVRENREIILIDHRGTGKSHKLGCDLPGDLTDFTLMTGLARKCREKHDVDVRLFGLEPAMRDIAEITAAMGYDKLNLWGGSYGTRAAALLIRRFPERIRSAVLDGVLAPDMALFESAPLGAERALTKLFDDCEQDVACNRAFPDFRTDTRDFLDSLTDKDFITRGLDPITMAPYDLALPKYPVVHNIRAALYDSNAAAILPLALQQAQSGNGNILAALQATIGLAVDSMALGSTLSILCGDEIARNNGNLIAEVSKDTFTEDSYFLFWQTACQGWDYLEPPADVRAPLVSDLPILLLSGDLDPVTPPSNGEYWLKTLTAARHIVVPGTGHITSMAGCMPSLIGDFVEELDSSGLDASCLDKIKRPAFVTSVMGPSREQTGDEQ